MALITPDEVEKLIAVCGSRLTAERILVRRGLTVEEARKALDGAYARLAAVPPISPDARREVMRGSLSELYAKSLAKGHFNAALGALDKLCKLDGLYAPTKVEAKVTEQRSIYESDPDRVRARIRDLLAKHPEYALPEPVPPSDPDPEVN